ncbi:MAG TPA: P1 family peptidase [Candidatus Stackebrandtia faecavium]|nr:P1 family peptidase [Candidatus Stackebrandtia faecavium]
MLEALKTRVGHWTHAGAKTGCTAILFDADAVASAEVRGGAPASRELDLLSPQKTVTNIDGIVLTGGSAFGLAAADGAMRYLHERDRGVATPGGKVPIVPTLALFDLANGDERVVPNADAGYAACVAALTAPEMGSVGAGTGATTGAVTGTPTPAGIAMETATRGALQVTAIVAVNAFGVIDAHGDAAQRLAGTPNLPGFGEDVFVSHTTIGAVITNAELDKTACRLVAQGAHHGLARAVAPSHTRFDGDAFITASTGTVPANVDVVALLATVAVADAICSFA